MHIDSVQYGPLPLTYIYDDTTDGDQFPLVLNAEWSIDITVAYHGAPWLDPRFGGFTFSGVPMRLTSCRFIAIPIILENPGFPVLMSLPTGQPMNFILLFLQAIQRGVTVLLESTVVNPSGSVTYNWKLQHTIPTYLAGLLSRPL